MRLGKVGMQVTDALYAALWQARQRAHTSVTNCIRHTYDMSLATERQEPLICTVMLNKVHDKFLLGSWNSHNSRYQAAA